MRQSAREFHAALLSDPMHCLASYCGEGILTLESGAAANCRFAAAQLRNGEVVLLCDSRQPFDLQPGVRTEGLSGRTREGYQVRAGQGLVSSGGFDSELRDETLCGEWAVILARDLLVQHTEGTVPKTLRFGITNLRFVGTDSRPGFPRLVLRLGLVDDGQSTSVEIEPVENYDQVLRRVRILRTTDVTCEALAEVPAKGSVAQVLSVIDDLCYILSIARGTKVQWVYCNEYSETGATVSRKHSSRVTKPYSSFQAIDPTAGGRKHTKDFIESAYRTFVERTRSWPRLKASIDAYLDAKAEGDFLEMRGAKLAVALEALKAALIEMPNSEAREFIIDKHDFKRDLAKPLMDAIACVLQSSHVAPDLWQQLCNEGKVKELNRTSFRRLLKYLCRHIGLHVSAEDLDLVINARNSLVHRGRFYCNTACDEASKVCSPLGSESEQYCFLVNFLDKVFLKLLGYSGPYVNWRSPGNPVMEPLE